MRIFQPRMELRPYVRYYWIAKCDLPFRVLTFPIGCPQMIFHRCAPLYIPELSSRQNRFTISGQVNFPAHIVSDGNIEMIVAVFYPHTIGMFIDTAPSAFYNQEISGYDVENKPLTQLAHRIFGCLDSESAILLIERWLATVNTLAGISCLGKKQFERLFRQYVGMNPKEYGRIVRFQRTLRMMQLGFRNYADIAYANGYADQSHLIREFRRFSGFTPRRLTEYQAPYSDLFTQPQLFEY